MNKNLYKKYWVMTALSVLPTLAMAGEIDVKREEIVIFSRLGEDQLSTAIEQMKTLYLQTKDKLVRDDLIALLMKKNRFSEVVSVCSNCKLRDFTENELENIAKAARNIKKYQYSLALYEELNHRFSKNSNGLLGCTLVSIDMGDFNMARRYLTNYQKRFGKDRGYIDASTYLNDRTEGDMAKLGRLQNELALHPENKEIALQLYRLAAKYKIDVVRERIIQNYPTLLTDKDLLWQEYEHTINFVQVSNSDPVLQEQAYAKLLNLSKKLDKNSPLYKSVLQDRFVLATKLNKNKDAEQLYLTLQQQYGDNELPNYVKESYADYLLASGSPFKALTIYKEIEKQQIAKNHKAAPELLLKLFRASSDAGYFEQAQTYLDSIKATPYILDFTQKQRIANPLADAIYYAKINLNTWRGKSSEALALLNERLAGKKMDPWVMLARSEFERFHNNNDDALYWANKAQAFLFAENHLAVQAMKTHIALDNGDYTQASNIINQFTEQQRNSQKSLIERYELARKARLVGSLGLSHRTSKNAEGLSSIGNEFNQEYYLYSPKTEDGHSIYLHYINTKSPDIKFKNKFRLERLGTGLDLNFYPFNLNLEVGRYLNLNDKIFEQYQLKNKVYLQTKANYRLNQRWQFNLNASKNGSNTPVKAIYQNIDTKNIGLGMVYTYADLFSLGANFGLMKFDDGNKRKNASFLAKVQTFVHDLWNISNSLRFDYMRNSKNNENIWYYNPLNSRSLETGIDVSYNQPLNYGLSLNHHFNATLGHHWQSGIINASIPSNKSSEKTWSISYGHNWRIDKKIEISYEVGRKRNIYDGEAEYNNFANLGFSIIF
ncbi:poly-beta-1,6 N-acetyl-D-glucosamine export porin PgaA [Lonepinella koalarum]|uniref:poly-beta-1,6 N-acetyl-D-glucosamine export porin PgaA n=1 Tax=Lonepinella koalarum TaxID=53417 RepID=UPI0011E4C862|nr:poly-beta-1,6 N-acetyl-D-glucosamine export porin PgaA [Lonepinella koalarum]TYG34293.1 poly-beta-1,6 N-acetyl-D-glucosamine export porin PgaA [Lonepinella koalarum]